MDFTKDELAAWLKEHGRSREWLANATGKSLGTIHNWFSNRDIPEDARATIALLMERDKTAAPPDETGLITFTTAEFEEIEEARRRVGLPPRPQFYRDGILQYVERIQSAQGTHEPAAPPPGKILPIATAAEGGDSGAAILGGPPDPDLQSPPRRSVTYRGGKKK